MEYLKNKFHLIVATVFMLATPASHAAVGDLKTGVTHWVDQISSTSGVISAIAFILGMVAIYKCVVTFLNHSDDPREYPMKNVIFYAIAAAIGLGYAFSAGLFTGTIWGESDVGNQEMFKFDSGG